MPAGKITIKNCTNPPSAIKVRVTFTDAKTERFYKIAHGDSEEWSRGDMQIAFIFKEADKTTEIRIVEVGETYLID